MSRVTGGYGHGVLYPAKGLIYAGQLSGLLGAIRLDSGKYHYGLELMFGQNYERNYIARQGERVLAVSSEKMMNPHADTMPDLSTIEMHTLSEPEGPQGLGQTTASELLTSLIRKGQPVQAAANAEQVVAVIGNNLFTMDWDLKIKGWVKDQFRAVQLSLDEGGMIYLCVEELPAKRTALWVLDAHGARQIHFIIDAAPEALIAPPIVGYDHTVYLLTERAVIAVRADGQLLWNRPAQTQIAGAVVTPDGKLLTADGLELATIDRDGKRAVLFRAQETLVTAPLMAGDGRILVASAKTLFLLQGK
ncbi:MAG: hypothetical protein HY273_03910 [Gammaproteobacteria bacterium]|nr:hypothetical protein [Gammaproteobacteria bacterium]